ncbi:hypothetical protein P4O66_019977, partial [Electrophorus voltai]
MFRLAVPILSSASILVLPHSHSNPPDLPSCSLYTDSPRKGPFLCPHPHYPHIFYLKSQQLNSQVAEQGNVMYNVDSAQVLPAPVDLKPDDEPKLECAMLKSSSPALRPVEPPVQRREPGSPAFAPAPVSAHGPVPAPAPTPAPTPDSYPPEKSELPPQMFNQLMKQVMDLTIDTEERFKGVVDLVFEKAIDEPSFSMAYGNMCSCLAMLKVPMADKPTSTVSFQKLLLNRCQKEFEKDKVNDDVLEKLRHQLEAATSASERERLEEDLEEAKDKAHRRSIGNIKFIGELFKLHMLSEAIMHDCVVKLFMNHSEESLERLCHLLTAIGKDLDLEKARPKMDHYFKYIEKTVKERRGSSRIRFLLQDVIHLRL